MNSLLIRSVQIADPAGSWHGRTADVYVEDGVIVRIGTDLHQHAENIIQGGGACLSPGWVDALTFCGEPGEEWKETLASLASAAQAGGFTSIAAYCGTHPAPDSAAAISSVLQKASGLPVRILPLGATTVKEEGVDMAELYDMWKAGAVAFTDGEKPLSNNGLKARIMEYAANQNIPVYMYPFCRDLAPGGSMHEGKVSNSLGLKGIPVVSETIALESDLQLAAWLRCPLRIVKISSAAAVDRIRKAKADGADIRVAVAIDNLLYTDENLTAFDENHKVLPPLRTEKDREALWAGLNDGTLDAVVSNHIPQDTESKRVEFDYSAWGSAGIQTMLPALLRAGNSPDIRVIVTALSYGPRKLLNLPVQTIQEGQPADFTLFSATTEWEFSGQKSLSKAVNIPMLGEKLKGLVLGTVLAGKWQESPVYSAAKQSQGQNS
ncbi:MAG: dihydroorotase [Bacteroidetes bacterium]|nr:dihydroorotase [Bacteroidota bacterium]